MTMATKTLDAVIKSRRTMIARLQVELAELENLRKTVTTDPNQNELPLDRKGAK